MTRAQRPHLACLVLFVQEYLQHSQRTIMGLDTREFYAVLTDNLLRGCNIQREELLATVINVDAEGTATEFMRSSQVAALWRAERPRKSPPSFVLPFGASAMWPIDEADDLPCTELATATDTATLLSSQPVPTPTSALGLIRRRSGTDVSALIGREGPERRVPLKEVLPFSMAFYADGVDLSLRELCCSADGLPARRPARPARRGHRRSAPGL